MKVTLSMTQRIALDALLGAQRGNLDKLTVPHEIRQKVRVPAELRKQFLIDLGDGRAMLDQAALVAAESTDVELEKEEVRRLDDLLTSWDQFGDDDIEWVLDLKAQLKPSPANKTA